jgi:hypothetical protein
MRIAVSTAAVLALVVALPGTAAADVLDLYGDYRRIGSVEGCDHSAAELRAALGDVPADINAYDPGFVDALNKALDRRAAGCAGAAQADRPSPAAVTAEDGSPGPANPRHRLRPVPGPAPDRAPLTVMFGAVALALTGSLAVAAGLGRRRAGR